MPHRARVGWVVLPAFVVFVAHAALFGDWIVDDAGISFAYARNLSVGEGLVAQPGAEPVEGFSNALWTLLLAACHRVGGFDPVRTPKIVSSGFALASFVLLAGAVSRRRRAASPVALALVASAAATPFVVWSISGLENALYVFLLAALAALCVDAAGRGGATDRMAVASGALCALVALTRPDGILYLPLPPLLFAAAGDPRPFRAAALHGLAFTAPWTLVSIARIAYFGDVLPNTYYAKRGPGWAQIQGLVDGYGPVLGALAVALAMAAAALAAPLLAAVVGRRAAASAHAREAWVVLGAFLATAYVVLEALPTDWMPEVRFGTPLFLFAPLAAVEAHAALARRRPAARRVAAWVVPALLVVAAALYSVRHSPAFRREPTVPFSDVRELSAELDHLADRAGVERASVLLPDVGGSLWEDRFDVVDMAGLTDRKIGRRSGDRRAFLDHVLETRPHLVWVHGYWLEWADLEADATFRAAYRPVPPRLAPRRPGGRLYAERSMARRLRRER